MPISDAEFARVLNHLYLMSADSRLDDHQLAEGLIRAAIVLLSARDGPNAAVEATSKELLEKSLTWCRRITPTPRSQRRPPA